MALGPALGDPQGLPAVGRRRAPGSPLASELRDDQASAPAPRPPRPGPPRPAATTGRLVRAAAPPGATARSVAGQVDVEGGARARLRSSPDEPAGSAGRCRRRWTSPSPVPLPGPLVVKKGSKRRRQDLRRHADAGVGHRAAGRTSPGDALGEAPGLGLASPRRCAVSMREPPARGHGVAGVHRQVHEHLLDLAGVGADAPQRRAARSACELDVLADEPPQHLLDARDHGVEVERPRAAAPACGRRPAAAGSGRAARSPAARISSRSSRERVAGGAAPPGRARRSQDDGEEVVEVVGHAAGQRADGLQLLGVPPPLPLPQLLGDVPRREHVVASPCRARPGPGRPRPWRRRAWPSARAPAITPRQGAPRADATRAAAAPPGVAVAPGRSASRSPAPRRRPPGGP